MASGIYKILIGPYFYFGQSSDMTRRKSEHCWALVNQKHKNPILQAAFNKYERFDLVELFSVPTAELDIEEQLLIDLHWGNPYLANISRIVGHSTRGIPFSDERKARHKEQKQLEWAELPDDKKVAKQDNMRRAQAKQNREALHERNRQYRHTDAAKEAIRNSLIETGPQRAKMLSGFFYFADEHRFECSSELGAFLGVTPVWAASSARFGRTVNGYFLRRENKEPALEPVLKS